MYIRSMFLLYLNFLALLIHNQSIIISDLGLTRNNTVNDLRAMLAAGVH